MYVEPCLMMEKIEWYQEILRLDPDSRAFFPLAKLLRESQQPEKAIEVLRAGLQHSSVYLEARLLLIQLLFEQSRQDECAGELSAVTGLLEDYPAFWEVWADSVSGKNRDLALAIRLMASTVRHPERSLAQILESGLELLQDVRRTFSTPLVPSGEPGESASDAPSLPSSPDDVLSEGFPLPVPTQPEEPETAAVPEMAPESVGQVSFADDSSEEYLDADAFFSEMESADEEGEGLDEEPTLRTRSMADILAAQGDIAGALEIYQELEAAAPTPEEARELHDGVVALASRIAGMDSGEQPENGEPSYGDMGSQSKLMSLLESLADRLEARARA